MVFEIFRVKFASLASPAGLSAMAGQDEYQQSFDLLACQSVEMAQRSGMAPSTTTTVTSYQDHFGTWSSLYGQCLATYDMCNQKILLFEVTHMIKTCVDLTVI